MKDPAQSKTQPHSETSNERPCSEQDPENRLMKDPAQRKTQLHSETSSERPCSEQDTATQ